MAITDEDRAKLGDLAMRGIDQIIEHYGEDASLEDAVLLFEVAHPDPEFEDELATSIHAESTSHRATVTGGMAQLYAHMQLHGHIDSRDE